ncbi:carbamoyl-phosphate synthase large subunit [Barrientosiimonas humi]|uniref:Carbamoyl-phosphate synthase large subunit n=1 Tax=Barrientosiimonas humi TaxID=999931 RepID=A0A542XEI1_9MICO|nr:ATP-grasp domain-containing protein [Barrientosiimonas humi]TQL34233.1 carbamoyl-phosphate synthase large subunit [Barrientosiimonas humi]CAG7574225.1 hypothetical protein BH39T_PBIAJDOK_02868 [Barrientosiimonas humi]
MLVTGAETPAGREVLRQLCELGCVSVAVNRRTRTPARGAAGTRISAVAGPLRPSDPGWIPHLQQLVAEHHVDLIIPTGSDELPALAAARTVFGPGVAIALPADAGALVISHDHLFSCWHLYRHGVAVPKFAVPSTFGVLGEELRPLGVPVVLKRRVTQGGYEMRVMSSDEAARWAARDDSWIVQEYVPGVEYTVVVWQPVSEWFHEPVVVTLRRAKDGHFQRAPEDRDVDELAGRAVRALGLTGPVCLRIRRRTDGTPLVISVAPRVTEHLRYVPEILERIVWIHRQRPTP